MQDRDSRFVLAWASWPIGEDLIEQAVTIEGERMQQWELHRERSDWYGYGSILERTYHKLVFTGKRERPRLVVPQNLSLTQTVKHRDEHGRLLLMETRVALGVEMKPAGTAHYARLS